MNPTEQFRAAVESAVAEAGARAHRWIQFGEGADTNWEAEALASIQASTVLLLERLREKIVQRYDRDVEGESIATRNGYTVCHRLAVNDIDQLIKDLSNE